MYEELTKILKASDNIVFFGGAGVSTESGIPDFRSEAGLYNAKQSYGKSPEEMISHEFFMENTNTFYDYYKNNMVYQEAKPNDAHLAVAKLEEMGKLRAVVTQNIDGLHQRAGSKNVYELHGSILRNNCMNCGEFHDLGYIMDENNCDGYIPKCRKCGGILKPDVVLYNEPLDDAQVSGAIEAIRRADVLIIGGTSLVVYPAASYVNYFRGSKLVLINKSSTSFDGRADLVIHESIGEVLREATAGL